MGPQPKEGGNFPVSGIAAVLLVVLGVVVQQLPLEITRPMPSHVLRDDYPALQRMPARLWEDPFAAVAADSDPHSRGASTAPETRSHEPEPRSVETDARARVPELRLRETSVDELKNELRKYGPKSPCASVMPVMVFGGPYGEYSEVRRRTRHAVISGLLRSSYAPQDEDHIGYVRLAGEASSRLLVPFEWYQRKASDLLPHNRRLLERCGDEERVLVLWLDEDNFFDEPIAKLKKLLVELDETGAAIDRVRLIGPAGS
jgi:hypothetical protein